MSLEAVKRIKTKPLCWFSRHRDLHLGSMIAVNQSYSLFLHTLVSIVLHCIWNPNIEYECQTKSIHNYIHHS